MTAFDADVLIYAATAGHPLGQRVRSLLEQPSTPLIGSTLLIPELLIKPLRQKDDRERYALMAFLARLTLIAPDALLSYTAVTLGANYGLKALDALHLATAVQTGAERFVTNNRKDFSKAIVELTVVYPDEL